MERLYNPHGSDVTRQAGRAAIKLANLYNPHGSDVTR